MRKQLRGAYESLLFLDASFAAANDVESQLWKNVFYLPIEEFRGRMRQAEKVGWPVHAHVRVHMRAHMRTRPPCSLQRTACRPS